MRCKKIGMILAAAVTFAVLMMTIVPATMAESWISIDYDKNDWWTHGTISTEIWENGRYFIQDITLFGHTDLFHGVEVGDSFFTFDEWEGKLGAINIDTYYNSPSVMVDDTFYNGALGKFEGQQITTNVPKQWEWGSNDLVLDRVCTWNKVGGVYFNTLYESNAQWYNGEAMFTGTVFSTGKGAFLEQQLFTSHNGGVWEIDQWKTQRNMVVEVKGFHYMNFSINDMRGDDSGGSDYYFNFREYGTGKAQLAFDEFYINTEHGSGQWHLEDGYNIDMAYTAKNFPHIWHYGYGYTDLSGNWNFHINPHGTVWFWGTEEGN